MSLPARLRLTLLMTLAVYPVVTLYLYVLMPLTNGWDIWQRSLILVPMMSATIVLAVVPFINKRFSGFIAGRKAATA
ncbi:hypothetical protein [Devosia sp. Naph2]|uniref:hypothetical protein n=1 Tax=Devosia polycyclovorans TaxID=3345148 RepID=UPI0035D06194